MLLTRILKMIQLTLAVAAFLWRALWIHLTTTESHHRRKRFAHNVSASCRRMLFILHIDVQTFNLPESHRCFLIVSNHLGFIDIFAMASSVPTLFVTSVEMKETPFLGLLTEMAGCMYVERRNRNNISNEIKEIEATLNEGFNVVIYPEGRATNGEKVHPFKKSLLMACATSDANILPAVLNFQTINGEPMQHKFRDWVCWYDDLTFLGSIWRATQIAQCQLSLEFLDEVQVHNSSNHRDIAFQAQSQIEHKYKPIKYP